MEDAHSIAKVYEVLTVEEAEEKTRQYWKSLTPNERVQKMCELREIWMTPDERRLKRVAKIITVS